MSAQRINEYTEGNPVIVTFVFTDDRGQPDDPTTVTLEIAVAATLGGTLSTPTTFTCTDVPPATSTPAVGHLARTGLGAYETWVDTTGLVGYVTCQPNGIGIGQATPNPPEHVFRVLPRRIP